MLYKLWDIFGDNLTETSEQDEVKRLVLQQLPISQAKADKIPGRLRSLRLQEDAYIEYGGAAVRIKRIE